MFIFFVLTGHLRTERLQQSFLSSDLQSDVFTEARNNLGIVVPDIMSAELKLDCLTSIPKISSENLKWDIDSVVTRNSENRIQVIIREGLS